MMKKGQADIDVTGRSPTMVRRDRWGRLYVRLNSFVPIEDVEALEELEKIDHRPRGLIIGDALKQYARAQRRKSAT